MALSSMAAHCEDSALHADPSTVAESAYTSTSGAPTRMVSQHEFDRLKHQATRLEHLLQVLPAGVVVIDGRGVIRQANHQARDLLGEPLEGLLWRKVIARAFRPREDDGHEVSLRDGRKVKLSITPLVDEPGQLIVMTDLTETRQLQQRVSHMQRLSALGRTVASMVHQIRTPLSAAILYAANLTHKNLSSEAGGRFIEKLQSRLADLEGQINDMLLFAKSGEQQVVEPLAIADVMTDVVQGCEAMLNDVKGTLRCDTAAQELTVLGNRSALTGALQNLVHNALQQAGEGARVNITLRSEPQPPNRIVISVNDNGPGIADDLREKIFEPFFTTKKQGTGLGLAVVNAVAKSHGGFVAADNNPDGGACISMCLPLAMGNLQESNNAVSWQHTLGQENQA